MKTASQTLNPTDAIGKLMGVAARSALNWVACLSNELHPRIGRAIGLNFAAENYELAVFAAMREVEMRMREAIQGSDSDIGIGLARKAFDSEVGCLTDRTAEPGERQAMGHLFAGALGTFKNPGSHRAVKIDDPGEAAEIILLADLLMRILDRRDPNSS